MNRPACAYKLLIIDEFGYVPLSQTGAELLCEVFSQGYERGSTILNEICRSTSGRCVGDWTIVAGGERIKQPKIPSVIAALRRNTMGKVEKNLLRDVSKTDLFDYKAYHDFMPNNHFLPEGSSVRSNTSAFARR